MHGGKHLTRLTRVWNDSPVYFITVCTQNRNRLLDNPGAGDILLESWRSAPSIHGWNVGRYVIMPDHVHFFCAAVTKDKSLSGFLGDWKKYVARKCNRQRKGSGPFWQAEFFDHVMRSASSYREKWHYVRANPERAGLVSHPEEWPYQGEIERLEVR